ncbi:MAG: 2-oxo acid dehydrogenase subunit E2, partial [Pseudomonadota bacterium]
ISFLVKLPRPILRLACGFVRWADYYNLLPKSFIDGDGFYTTCVIANLGSLNMGAGFHHLYEWGNSALFMMVGKIEDRPVVVDGKVVPQKTLHIRWSYDERIDDGLTSRFGIEAVKNALEDPFFYFGCIKEDGSDARPLKALNPPSNSSSSVG